MIRRLIKLIISLPIVAGSLWVGLRLVDAWNKSEGAVGSPTGQILERPATG